ncbi:Uncharacterised protein [Klebsiella grimontii]|nr:Uncharacterised protein [Klebsiella grimontii]
MNTTLNKRWCLTALLALSAMVFTASSFAKTDKLVIESGDSAQSPSRPQWKKSSGTTPLFTPEGQHPALKKSGIKPTWLLTPG